MQPLRSRQRRQRTRHKIAEWIIQHVGKFADNFEAISFGRSSRQPIAVINKGEQRFDLVIAILTPLSDMQREIDLGVGGLDYDAVRFLNSDSALLRLRGFSS